MPDSPQVDKTRPIVMAKQPEIKVKNYRLPWIIFGVAVVLFCLALGSYLGYQNGISQRLSLESSRVSEVVTTQFNLGIVDLQAGRLQNAQTRFEYVINLDPSYPSAAEKLSQVLLALNLTQTPTTGPTPTLTTVPMTPTPDTRGEEELFNTVKQNMANKDWTSAINNLDALRKLNVSYRAVESDDMYFLALRNRGIYRITYEGQLEQGMYDLSLAERFGPLDSEAESFRIYARLYLDGASFWKVDWGIVVSYFSQVYEALPALRDSTGITAMERFRIAAEAYGDQLSAAKDYCKAQSMYEAAQSLPNNNANLEATISSAGSSCANSNSSATPEPQSTVSPETGSTATPTPDSGQPVAQTPTSTIVPPTETFTSTPKK